MRLTLCEAPTCETRPDHHRGGSRIFLGEGALVSCSTSTPTNHIVFFFWQNTSCIRKPQVISGGRGGAHPLHPPPRSAPALHRELRQLRAYSLRRVRGFFNVPRWPYNTEDAVHGAYDLSSLSEKTRTSFHLRMSLQRQHVKTLSVSPVWGWNRDLPHSSPALYQLS